MENTTSKPEDQAPGKAITVADSMAEMLYDALVEIHPNVFDPRHRLGADGLTSVMTLTDLNIHAVAAVLTIRLHARLVQALSPLPRKN